LVENQRANPALPSDLASWVKTPPPIMTGCLDSRFQQNVRCLEQTRRSVSEDRNIANMVIHTDMTCWHDGAKATATSVKKPEFMRTFEGVSSNKKCNDSMTH
jgi:hypothetical protein